MELDVNWMDCKETTLTAILFFTILIEASDQIRRRIEEGILLIGPFIYISNKLLPEKKFQIDSNDQIKLLEIDSEG